MLGVQADGLLYGVWRGRTNAVLTWLVDEGIPVVLFNRGAEGRGIAPCSPMIAPGPDWRWSICSHLGHHNIVHVEQPRGRLIYRQSTRGVRGPASGGGPDREPWFCPPSYRRGGLPRDE